jgi:hypothetical protein
MIAATDTLPGNGGYVAAAYLVFTALLLIYFVLMGYRLSRLERDVVALHSLLDARDGTNASKESGDA